MKPRYKAGYIEGFVMGQAHKLRQRRLDPEYITTLVEQFEYLIEREMDTECMKYITETFVEKISEHFYLGLNAKKYVNQFSDEFGVALIRDREIAICVIEHVVLAGCAVDYPLITNQ